MLLDSGEDTERMLKRLSEYFGGEPVDFDFADEFELLPLYVETESFVCVHSGAPLDENGGLLPLSLASVEELVFDRHFKNPDTVYTGEKCVFFGHTQTDAVFGENIILGHLRQEDRKPLSISDFSKIHLDTGAWSSGIMGCICVESVKAYYVYEDKKESKCTSL